jgi:hypothetical protein
MKLILKNSTIEFKTKGLTPVPLNSVINTPTSIYVAPDGSNISGGGEGDGNLLYVNVYAVEANTNYVIKSDPDWNTNEDSVLTIPVGISFGTNLLTSTGDIENPSLIKEINTKTDGAFEVAFTPQQNGYIYITEYDDPNVQVKCLSRVYEL